MNEWVGKYLKVIFARIWILLILAVASAGIVYFTCGKTFEKLYEAKMKLMITLNDSSVSGMNVYDSLRSSQMAAGDISQIINSDAVLAGLEKEYGVSQENIGNALDIRSIPNTRIMDISIRMNTPERALNMVESIDSNLKVKLAEIDKSITYKILSKPSVNTEPVNRSYPVYYAAAAAMGGILLGMLINLIIGESGLPAGSMTHVRCIFPEENILPVPASRLSRQEGGAI